MRSLDLTSNILKDRSPAFTRSPIAPSGLVCAFRFVSGSRVPCLEAPAITPSPSSFPPPAEEQAGESSKAATNTASIMAIFTGASVSLVGRPRGARLYDGRRGGRHYALLHHDADHYSVTTVPRGPSLTEGDRLQHPERCHAAYEG